MARRPRYSCKDGHFDCAITPDGECRAERDAIAAAKLTPPDEAELKYARTGLTLDAQKAVDARAYAKRVAELEAEDMTTSDAQAVADAELMAPSEPKCYGLTRCETHQSSWQRGKAICQFVGRRPDLDESDDEYLDAVLDTDEDTIITTEVNLTAYADLLSVVEAAKVYVEVPADSTWHAMYRDHLLSAIAKWNVRLGNGDVPVQDEPVRWPGGHDEPTLAGDR